MPEHLRYRFCPMCTGRLVGIRDHDGLFRAKCSDCGWLYYPPNVLGVNIVITTPEGIVFLFPPEEPAGTAAMPGGCVEFGETPEEAAIREAREETGLEVEIVRELGRSWNRYLPLGPMLSFIFETLMVGGTLRDGVEGQVAAFDEGEFPTISPNRTGSHRALAAYVKSRR